MDKNSQLRNCTNASSKDASPDYEGVLIFVELLMLFARFLVPTQLVDVELRIKLL